MKKEPTDLQKWLSKATLLVLAAGAVLRVVIYFQNRSLFIDEASLARNYAERAWWSFFEPLEYGQYAPPFFSMIESFFFQLLGSNEWGLRTFPMLCGLAAIPVFYLLLLRHFKQGWVQLFLAWIFCFSGDFVRYATEGKQYASDILTTLLLIWLAEQTPLNDFSWKKVISWSIIGSIAIWFSMPSAFVLAGVGLFFFFRNISSINDFYRLGITVLIWTLNFGCYYYILLRPEIGSDYLEVSHQLYFPPFFPTSNETWQQYSRVFFGLYHSAIGFTAISYAIGIIASLLGIGVLFYWRTKQVLLILVPIVACWLAAIFHYYSLMPRLTLFMIPLLMFLIGYGLEFVFHQLGKSPFRFILVALLILAASIHQRWRHFYTPYEIEATRPALQYISDRWQKGDILFVWKDGIPPVRFYTETYDQADQFQMDSIRYGDHWDTVNPYILKRLSNTPRQRFWVLYPHLLAEHNRIIMQQQVQLIEEQMTLEMQWDTTGTEVFLFGGEGKKGQEEKKD
jgi:hypothetical protein